LAQRLAMHIQHISNPRGFLTPPDWSVILYHSWMDGVAKHRYAATFLKELAPADRCHVLVNPFLQFAQNTHYRLPQNTWPELWHTVYTNAFDPKQNAQIRLELDENLGPSLSLPLINSPQLVFQGDEWSILARALNALGWRDSPPGKSRGAKGVVRLTIPPTALMTDPETNTTITTTEEPEPAMDATQAPTATPAPTMAAPVPAPVPSLKMAHIPRIAAAMRIVRFKGPRIENRRAPLIERLEHVYQTLKARDERIASAIAAREPINNLVLRDIRYPREKSYFEHWYSLHDIRRVFQYLPEKPAFPAFKSTTSARVLPRTGRKKPWVLIDRINATPQSRNTLKRLLHNRIPLRRNGTRNCVCSGSIQPPTRETVQHMLTECPMAATFYLQLKEAWLKIAHK
ncbi:hypothetical protein H4R23_006381, partial [Coemansia sp. Cherry 401B]